MSQIHADKVVHAINLHHLTMMTTSSTTAVVHIRVIATNAVVHEDGGCGKEGRGVSTSETASDLSSPISEAGVCAVEVWVQDEWRRLVSVYLPSGRTGRAQFLHKLESSRGWCELLEEAIVQGDMNCVARPRVDEQRENNKVEPVDLGARQRDQEKGVTTFQAPSVKNVLFFTSRDQPLVAGSNDL